MKRSLKRAAQIVVLTMVLLFASLLVVNTGFVTKDAEAGNHIHNWYHVTKYYLWGKHAIGYIPHLDYISD